MITIKIINPVTYYWILMSHACFCSRRDGASALQASLWLTLTCYDGVTSSLRARKIPPMQIQRIRTSNWELTILRAVSLSVSRPCDSQDSCSCDTRLCAKT